MDYISLMFLVVQTQLKKHHQKGQQQQQQQKKSQTHCCLLFSLLDVLSGTQLGFSNGE